MRRRKTLFFRFRSRCEDITDETKYTGIGRRIGSRRPADRILIHRDHLIDISEADDLLVRPRLSLGMIEMFRERPRENVMDER